MATEYGDLVHTASEGLFWWKDHRRLVLHLETQEYENGYTHDWHDFYFIPPSTWQPVQT